MKRFASLSIVAVLAIASLVSASQTRQPAPTGPEFEILLPAVPAQAQPQDQWTVMDRYDLLMDEPLFNGSEMQIA